MWNVFLPEPSRIPKLSVGILTFMAYTHPATRGWPVCQHDAPFPRPLSFPGVADPALSRGSGQLGPGELKSTFWAPISISVACVWGPGAARWWLEKRMMGILGRGHICLMAEPSGQGGQQGRPQSSSPWAPSAWLPDPGLELVFLEATKLVAFAYRQMKKQSVYLCWHSELQALSEQLWSSDTDCTLWSRRKAICHLLAVWLRQVT